jgi:hypothetical protein
MMAEKLTVRDLQVAVRRSRKKLVRGGSWLTRGEPLINVCEGARGY